MPGRNVAWSAQTLLFTAPETRPIITTRRRGRRSRINPSKRKRLNQCRFNVGPASLNQCRFNVGQMRPAPMAHSYRLGLVSWRYQARIPVGPDICHLGCAYTVLQTVQRHGVYSAAYGTVHYKEPLKSFEITVRRSPGFGLPSVAILPWCIVQKAT